MHTCLHPSCGSFLTCRKITLFFISSINTKVKCLKSYRFDWNMLTKVSFLGHMTQISVCSSPMLQLYCRMQKESLQEIKEDDIITTTLERDNTNRKIPVSHKYPPGDWTRVPHDGKQTGCPLDQWDMVQMQWDCRLSTNFIFWMWVTFQKWAESGKVW